MSTETLDKFLASLKGVSIGFMVYTDRFCGLNQHDGTRGKCCTRSALGDIEFMTQRQFLKRLTATIAIAGMMVGTIANGAWTAVTLKNGDNVDGFVQTNSPTYRFKNPSLSGAPTQSARGEEYLFSAQAGNNLTIAIDVEDGSTLKPILVLFDPKGKQVAYDATRGLLKYRAALTGTHKLLVLGQSNTRGRYSISLVGLSSATSSAPSQANQADQVMKDVLRLNIIGCGVPNVAKIKIGTDERCTRDIEAGVYIYDAATSSIKPVDNRRELLAQRLQLTLLDQCPPAGTATVQITVKEPQDGKDYTYCANPTRFVKAGAYRYDIAADELKPIDATTATNPTPTPTPTPTSSPSTAPDPRRQLLQDDYGLRVLDGCPAARSSLVVVSFTDPQSAQKYVYCANPNRVIVAGEYTYNNQTQKLEPAKQPAPDCTISLGGVCIVK
jgi:hypothetical protein